MLLDNRCVNKELLANKSVTCSTAEEGFDRLFRKAS